MSKKPSFTVSGLDAFKGKLDALDRKTRNKVVRDALRKGAKVMAAEVRRLAPVESGKLKSSVKVRAGKRKRGVISMQVEVTGGHETPMVAAVEYGWSRDVPHPFIRPGFEATKDEVGARLLAEIKAGVEAQGKK